MCNNAAGTYEAPSVMKQTVLILSEIFAQSSSDCEKRDMRNRHDVRKARLVSFSPCDKDL